MTARRPALIGPSGALAFAPSETADQTISTSWIQIVKVATRYGSRFLKLTLDSSDNLTVSEVDAAGNLVGLGTIVSAVNVAVGAQLNFRVGPTNLSGKYQNPSGSAQGSGAAGQVNTQTGVEGGDVFTFVNGNTGTDTGLQTSTNTAINPDRQFAGFSLEADKNAGGQVN